MIKNMQQECIELLNQRGVTIKDIAECSLFLQKKYHPTTSLEEYEKEVINVINKREVQHAILTGIELDMLAENNQIKNPYLSELINKDHGLYGLDEVLAYGICNLYGSIALTNFGFIDKEKVGIIEKLNNKNNSMCHTFLDDIVGAIAASAASKLAHTK